MKHFIDPATKEEFQPLRYIVFDLDSLKGEAEKHMFSYFISHYGKNFWFIDNNKNWKDVTVPIQLEEVNQSHAAGH